MSTYYCRFKKDSDTNVVEIPRAGFSKEDIEIKSIGGMLEVLYSDGVKVLIDIPKNANIKKLKAVQRYGMLTLTVPDKYEDIKIEIEGD